MLGLAHTLIATSALKDAAWAARICDVDASVIRGLCQRMTAQRMMLSMSWSIQRADHGEQPCWHSRRSTASPSGALNENEAAPGPCCAAAFQHGL
jgi:hypothetical protein